MKKSILIIMLSLFVCQISFSQNTTTSPHPTSKNIIPIISKNMDWYKVTFDVNLDDGDTINTELINAIDFNSIENQRQETEDIEIELEINDIEIEIILFSYNKCALLKNNNREIINTSNE